MNHTTAHTTRTVWMDEGDHAAARCTCGWTGPLYDTSEHDEEQLGALTSKDAVAHRLQPEWWKP